MTWFQLEWPPTWRPLHIAAKELLPIVASAALWGKSWHGARITFYSDNAAVVQALNSRSARDPILTHLISCLFFFEARFQFDYSALHIAGSANAAADALSRNSVSTFVSLYPQAPTSPTMLPTSLQELLLDHELTWTSQRWAVLFRNTLQEVSPSGP